MIAAAVNALPGSTLESPVLKFFFFVAVVLLAVAFGYYQWSRIFRTEIRFWMEQALSARKEANRLRSDLLELMLKTGKVPKPVVVQKTPEEERRLRRAEKARNIAKNTDNPHEAAAAKAIAKELSKPPGRLHVVKRKVS